MHKKLYFNAVVHIEGIDRIGLLNEVTALISNQMNINIHKVMITSEEGIVDGVFDLRVHDREDLKVVIDGLKKIEGLQEVAQIM